jgi:type IV secretion system protein VirB4
MMRHRAIRRDFDAAGSVNALIALWGFVDDTTFLTKAGHVGVVYRLHGLDYEGLDHEARRAVVHRAEAALRLLDDTFRVYQYLCKRRVPPIVSARCARPVVDAAVQARAAHLNAHVGHLFEMDLYLVVVYEGLARTTRTSTRLERVWHDPAGALRAWLSPGTVLSLLEEDLDRAIATLHHAVAGVEIQLADTLRPTRLPKAEAFRFFRRLVNYAPGVADAATLAHDTHLDFFVASSSVACHRTHLEVHDVHVKVLTMADPPTATFAHVLEDLYTVPGEFIACLEWQRLANDRMRRDLQSRRRHWYHKRVSMVNYVSSSERHPDERPLVDQSAEATVDQLGDALTAMEVEGHFFGECSVTLVLYGREGRAVERAAAEALKVLATHDGAFHDETYNLVNAWVSIVPGNSAYNLRRLPLLETHCADLSFLFSLDQGERTSAQLGGREALAIFQTRHDTPYYFNLHVDDVGHTLVLGATGSGKSFLLNFLVTHAQKYEPRTVIFDLGHSYRKLASALGGSYLELGLHAHGLTINPFALPNTPEHLHFLHAFVRVLLEGVDSYKLSDVEDRELYDAIANLYVLDREQRRLFTLANILPRGLGQRLSRWVGTGRYAHLFDHVEDTLTVHTFQVFDFDAMREYPELLEPLLFYVLHRVTASVTDQGDGAQLKLCLMDEAWRFIQHPMVRAYVQEALKTWRKRNAAMVLATQAVEDFAASALLRAVLESCPTTLLLANPALDRQQYAELFRLNALELDRLTRLTPRRELLLKRPHTSKVLTLDVDAPSYALYATGPVDHARRAAPAAAPVLTGGLARQTALA